MVTAGGPTPDDESPHEGRVIGRYLILDEIASGGMATVHLAHVEGNVDRFVAVKCMHAHYARDPDFVSMFLDEAMLCTRIRHENVVATIDVSQEHNELLLVLELVDGESLSRLIKTITARRARVPQAIASAMVRDMLKGLHAAHEATNEAGEPLMIVHRDVSPHNVLVGTDGVVKVLDFGVAKARGRVQQTQKGQLKGKLAYMSPEQARGRTVDRRSDVFAAGIVLWELLVGQRLFDGDNEAALLVSLLSDKPAPPSKHDPSLAKFDALVLKALATDPEERFATAEEMASAVAAAIPPASRAEIAAWVKTEAKAALARRADLIRRARARVLAVRGLEDQDSTAQDDVPTRAVAVVQGHDAPSRSAGLAVTPAPPRPPRAPKLTSPAAPPRIGATPATGLRSPAPATASPPSSPAGGARGETPAQSSDVALWDTSTTSEDGLQTLAMPLTPASSHASFSAGVDPRDATLPLYSPPAAFMAAAGIPVSDGPPSEGVANPWAASAPPVAAVQAAMPQAAPASARHAPVFGNPTMHQAPGLTTAIGFPGEPESRAETIPSQVTSVTLTTTDLPPPLPPEHVRRLKLIGIASGAVGALAAVALLVILTRKPTRAADSQPAGATSAPIGSPTATASANVASPSAAPATTESASLPASTGSASASSLPSAAASLPATAGLQPMPRPTATPTYRPQLPTSRPVGLPTSTGKSTAKPPGTTKPPAPPPGRPKR